MPARVVDASAAAALLFGEPRAEDVAAALEGADLLAPGLLRYEVGSVCLKKIRKYPARADSLLAALALLGGLGVREVDVPIEEIVPLAGRESLTIYDAAYLWLARTLRADLVTLDGRLRAASLR